jgi:hypothetical protein
LIPIRPALTTATPPRYAPAMRGALLVLLGAALARAATLPAGVATGRFESPNPSYAVQPDSVFAPVVGATPAVMIEPGPLPKDAIPTDPVNRAIPLDGTWRFQLETSDCTADETQCDGIVQHWFAPGYDDGGWRTLPVPGHFMLQILAAELGGRGSDRPFHFAWYRTKVTVPADAVGGTRRLRLLFEAVDYRADVWWDGQLLTTHGSHLGTFNPFAFDLPTTTTAGTHTLAVRVQKPLDPGILSCGGNTGAGTDFKTILDGTKGYWDGRPGGNSDDFDVRTKQWLHTGGIARPVSLVSTGPIRIDAVFVTARPTGRRGADVLLAYTMTNRSEVDLNVEITTTFDGPGLKHRGPVPREGVHAEVFLHPGANRFELPAHLRRARPWFPAGNPELGAPVLYGAETSVVFATPSDRRRDVFGIRTLAHYSDRCEDRFAGEPTDPTCADAFGYTAPRTPQGTPPEHPLFQRFVNGERIFVKGAALDPDAWAARIDATSAARTIGLLRGLNANQAGLAVQIAPPVFYDAADAAGVMVVQDFELQWTYNDNGVVFGCQPDGSAFPVETGRTDVSDRVVNTAALLAADMTYLLYNHPSIVHWVAHNEPAWELAEVLGPAFPLIGALSAIDRRLDRTVVDVVSGIDATRPVKAAAGVGDSHQYSGYLLCSFYDLLGLDPTRTLCNAESTRPVALLTEFGSHVWPFSAKRWMDPAALFPANRATRRQTWTDADPIDPTALVPWLREWLFHTSTMALLETWVGSPADYDRFQDFALASQLYQRAFLAFYIEHYRIERYRPTAGIRLFQLRDYWDQGYFGIYDQYDVPAAAAETVRDAYAPLFVTSVVPKPFFAPGEHLTFPVWIANDVHRRFHGTLAWRIHRVSDAYVLRGVQDFDGPPFTDIRRVFLSIPEAAPPWPVITTVPRVGAPSVGDDLASGTHRIVVDPDGGSPAEGETTITFDAPPGPETVRFYVLELALRRGKKVVARNAHLITVADPSWNPPPGLSEGTTPYGTDPGDRPLAFALDVGGLSAGESVVAEVPQYGGGVTSTSAVADADGVAHFAGLVPDEYVIRRGGSEVAHVGLVEDMKVDVGGK